MGPPTVLITLRLLNPESGSAVMDSVFQQRNALAGSLVCPRLTRGPWLAAQLKADPQGSGHVVIHSVPAPLGPRNLTQLSRSKADINAQKKGAKGSPVASRATAPNRQTPKSTLFTWKWYTQQRQAPQASQGTGALHGRRGSCGLPCRCDGQSHMSPRPRSGMPR